ERNHLDELYYYDSTLDFLKKNVIKILMKMTYKNATKIIGNTKKLSNDLSVFVNSKVNTIYSPTNSKEINRLSKIYKPRDINKDNKKIRLLSVSRFTKRKDLITILKAFRIINKKYNNIELILIGYGPELKNLKNYIQEKKIHKKVFILPFKKNPYPYFLISDIYIMPSLYEGCPNSIIESLVLNLPVISSNCNSGPDEILLNGKGGFIFKKKNFLELVDRVDLYMKNKLIFKKKLNLAKKKVFRFEEKKIISEYLNLFKEI
ncbi:glycosyltransferase, partial [Candidatus Pelagibacter sp.]|nr:glycosyltransferase [Candidatus Pelagibacter sp.]